MKLLPGMQPDGSFVIDKDLDKPIYSHKPASSQIEKLYPLLRIALQNKGNNCGTGAGGFKPGNTCAKFRASGAQRKFLETMAQHGGTAGAQELRRALRGLPGDPFADARAGFITVTMPMRELEDQGYVKQLGVSTGGVVGPGWSYAGPGSSNPKKAEKDDPARAGYELTEKGWEYLGLKKPPPRAKSAEPPKVVRDPETLSMSKQLLLRAEQKVSEIKKQKKPKLLKEAERKLKLARADLEYLLSLPEGTSEEVDTMRNFKG